MIDRNPEYARRREMRETAQRVAATQAARAGSSPATTQLVGATDPVSGRMVMFGILGVTRRSEPFRLKDG